MFNRDRKLADLQVEVESLKVKVYDLVAAVDSLRDEVSHGANMSRAIFEWAQKVIDQIVDMSMVKSGSTEELLAKKKLEIIKMRQAVLGKEPGDERRDSWCPDGSDVMECSG